MRQIKFRQVTCQTRFQIDENTDKTLTSYAYLLSNVTRKLFADSFKKSFSDLKSDYLKRFQITARQFNSCKIELEGKIAAYKETLSLLISKVTRKIKSTQNTMASLEKKKKKEELHQVKRRFFILNQKKQRLEEDQKKGKIRLCFGSKKLFKAQFNLEENGYANHNKWKQDWVNKRNRNFFIVGSKDESSGNQTCQIKLQENGKFSLFLRLPNGFDQKILVLTDIDIPYRKIDLLNCIKNNEKRKELQKLKNPSFKNFGQAINYRFLKDEKGWRVFISFKVFEPIWESFEKFGCIGVDININHLAVVETDRFGNPISKKNIPCCVYGKTKKQALAIIGDASKKIVELATSTKKPIVLENLDFDKKKDTLNKTLGKKYSRMLSSFSYKKIIETIIGKAWDEKIKVFQVNPAYTSVIGRVKFAKRYGLTVHDFAALVIARRYMRFLKKTTSPSSCS